MSIIDGTVLLSTALDLKEEGFNESEIDAALGTNYIEIIWRKGTPYLTRRTSGRYS